MFQNVRLKTRMILYICSVASVAFLLVIAFFALEASRTAKSQAIREAHEIAYRYGNVVRVDIEVALNTARAMAQMFEGMKISGAAPQRAMTNAILHQVLETYPQFLGVWTCWEPNQFDGRDAEFAGTLGHDETGRYIPYWVRTSKGLSLEPLKYYNVEGDGDWYLRPKKSGQETILDPFTYPIEGKDVLMTTISVPILSSQTVIGVTGVDIALTTFEEMIQQIHPFGVGSLAIIANNGTYVAHIEHEKTGKTIGANEEWLKVKEQIQQAQAFTRTEYSAELHSELQIVFAPVQLGRTTTPWSVAVTIPMKHVLEATTVMVYKSVGLGMASLGLMIAAIFLIARSITQPLHQIIRAAKELALGNFAQNISIAHNDEIGHLARTCQTMQATIHDVLVETERLITATQDGQLATRGHAERFQGEWQALILGINRLIDAFVSPITLCNQTLDQLARGDFTATLNTSDYRGDFLIMMNQFITMIEKLTEVVINVKTTAQDVALRSREMNVVAEQMSQGASQQAAATEEVSASMEEMAANIRQTAENARIGESMALTSADDARAGKHAVTEIIQAMEVIAERISVVQEIASQTNMLSLNATIEAAKAQEYGKGFTVVAASVRDLAHASRAAAEEIRVLVHSCVLLSAQAGDVLQRLVPNSEKTAELVQEISAASQEQAHGVEQVNQAIQQMDTVTQHNAATSEELASTAESLTTQADALQQAMAFFTVPERRTAAPATEDHDLLTALQTLAAKGASEQALGALVKSMLPAPTAPKRRDDDTPPQTPSPAELPASMSGAAIHPHMPIVLGDERDEEFEHY